MKSLKMRTKPLHKLEPQGVIRPTLLIDFKWLNEAT